MDNHIFKTVLLRTACLMMLAGMSVTAQAQTVFPSIFAGGTVGIKDLQTPSNSEKFRKDGGGVYLHHSAWFHLENAEKNEIQRAFSGQPFAVEIGYGDQWIQRYLDSYHNRGIRPKFITANGFALKTIPTQSDWAAFIAKLRAVGVDERTLILPTFEYANYVVGTLDDNLVSKRPDFQAIIAASGGITLDTPPKYFFAREEGYRRWVLDAIRWTKAQGMAVVIIVSPNGAEAAYAEKSKMFVDYLKGRNATPDMFVIENYENPALTNYLNVVGNEDNRNHQLGVARLLQAQWLPDLLGRTDDIDGDGMSAANERPLNRSDYDVRDFGADFDRPGDFQGWTTSRNINNFKVAAGKLSGTTTNTDPGVGIANLNLNGGVVERLQIRMRSSQAGIVQVYFGTDGNGLDGNNVVQARYDSANTWQVVTVPMATHAKWRNNAISTIRVDPISAINATFEIDWIAGAGAGFEAHSAPFKFDSRGNFKGWDISRNIANLQVSGGSLKGTTTSVDPQIQADNLHVDGDAIDVVQVYMRSSHAGAVQLYFGVNGGVVNGNNVASAMYNLPNTWQLVTIPVATNPNWKGHRISSLRLDPIAATDATFEISYISGVAR